MFYDLGLVMFPELFTFLRQAWARALPKSHVVTEVSWGSICCHFPDTLSCWNVAAGSLGLCIITEVYGLCIITETNPIKMEKLLRMVYLICSPIILAFFLTRSLKSVSRHRNQVYLSSHSHNEMHLPGS